MRPRPLVSREARTHAEKEHCLDRALERVPQQASPRRGKRTIGPRNSRNAEKARRTAPISSRIGPGPRKTRDLWDEVDPERHQRHAEVQALPVADVHRFLASTAGRAPSPTALPSRRNPRPPSSRSGPRPRGSSGSPGAEPLGEPPSSVSAIARRTSRPTRWLVLTGPIRCP